MEQSAPAERFSLRATRDLRQGGDKTKDSASQGWRARHTKSHRESRGHMRSLYAHGASALVRQGTLHFRLRTRRRTLLVHAAAESFGGVLSFL